MVLRVHKAFNIKSASTCEVGSLHVDNLCQGEEYGLGATESTHTTLHLSDGDRQTVGDALLQLVAISCDEHLSRLRLTCGDRHRIVAQSVAASWWQLAVTTCRGVIGAKLAWVNGKSHLYVVRHLGSRRHRESHARLAIDSKSHIRRAQRTSDEQSVTIVGTVIT